MKRYIYLLAIAALAAFGCTVTGPTSFGVGDYAGNKVKVTAPEAIPAQGGTVTAVVKTTEDADVPFTVSVPKAATWLKVGDITEERVETEVEKVVDEEIVVETVVEIIRTVRFTASTANESAEMRYASVGLIDTEKNIAITRFDVRQDGVGMAEKKPFEVSTKEINVEAAATTASFDIVTEVAWTVTSSNENFVVDPAAGEGNATVTVTFPANEGADAVVAELTVAATDPLARPKSHTVVITQASNVKTFTVTPGKTDLGQAEDRTSFSIESDVAWTITSSNPEFFLVDPSTSMGVASVSGEGNAEIQVLVAANFDLEVNKTTITVATEDAFVLTEKTITFEISQAAYTVPAGQVLAEWYFATSEATALKVHYDLPVKGELADMEGFGDVWVDANSNGSGKFQYWQVDKRPYVDKEHKRSKRTITGAGEPMALPSYIGDYALWTAYPSSPLAAGTKVHIFFAVRPNDAQCMKYWKLQYLDGTEWKPVADQIKTATTANGTFEYTHELIWNDLQYNTFVDAIVTLTASTSEVQFKFECVDNTWCDGTPWAEGYKFDGAFELRFAGYDSTDNEKKPNYRVFKRPVIEVVQ